VNEPEGEGAFVRRRLGPFLRQLICADAVEVNPEVLGLIPSAAWLSTTLYSGSPHHAVTYDTGRSASSCDHGTSVILRNVLVIHGCHSPFSS
jgi:hypothetical protein